MTKDSSSDSDGSIDDKSDVKKENMISCWQCPLCPMVYKRRFHFDKHVEAIHNLQPDEGAEKRNGFLWWQVLHHLFPGRSEMRRNVQPNMGKVGTSIARWCHTG